VNREVRDPHDRRDRRRRVDRPHVGPGRSESDVPTVDLPHLSPSKYVGKPCRVFGVDQLDSLGVTDPEQLTSRCRWTAGPKGGFGISLFGSDQGLARVYASPQAFPYFEPTSVAAYPAVDRDSGRAGAGTCATVVGIADAAAKHVAAVAAANIQGGG
jgi:hypothetical protein